MSKISQELQSSKAQCVVVGAGLAGSECAWQLAEAGLKVFLIEQKPQNRSAAHKTPDFAELVCSNSLKTTDPQSAPALLKSELVHMNSLILLAAHQNRVAAGQALAVERNGFSKMITETIKQHSNITVCLEELKTYEELFCKGSKAQTPVVFATGPLTSDSLAKSLEDLVGQRLSFYDAISPIIEGSSINKEIAFSQNRYDKGMEKSGGGDYLNCPMSKEQYYAFVAALKSAETVEEKTFEKIAYFQGCQPIEAIAESGERSLSFGPMKARGLTDPRSGFRPYAAVQLRKEDSEGRAWNIVGFQTKMKYPEQKRIFRTIPGLENAEFYRLGSIHRNTYLLSPELLGPDMALKSDANIFFAGQITGVEGYLESTAIGCYVGRQIAKRLLNWSVEIAPPPEVSALGALISAITLSPAKKFQPMNMNWGLVPLNGIGERDKEKKLKLVARAQHVFSEWMKGTQTEKKEVALEISNNSVL